jgi:hypothetical protein
VDLPFRKRPFSAKVNPLYFLIELGIIIGQNTAVNYISDMNSASRAAIYSVCVVLFVVGSWELVKAHPEVQFTFYIPAAALIIYAVIRDDLFAKPGHALRHAKGK